MSKPRAWRLTKALMLATVVVVALLRFVRLDADFPRGVTWAGVLHTDEGWWCYGAINRHQTGQWHHEGIFNPMINQPLFSLMLAPVFRVCGMSLVSARGTVAVFSIALLVVAYLFVRRHTDADTAFLTVFIMGTSHLYYAFSRLALLEVPLTFFACVSFLLVSWPGRLHYLARAALAAVCFFMAIMTKSSALFALPVLLFITWLEQRKAKRDLWACGCLLAVACSLWLAYYVIINHHFREDYRTYIDDIIRPTMSFGPAMVVRNVIRAVWNGRVVDLLMYPLTLVGVAVGVWLFEPFRRNRLLWISLAWIAMAGAVNVPRGYLPPRYYLPMLVPFVALLSMVCVQFYRTYATGFCRYSVVAVIVLIAVLNLSKTARYLCSLEFTMADMARDVTLRVESDERGPMPLLGNVAPNITLVTGLRSINSMFGTRDIAWKAATYGPGYYISLGKIPEHFELLEPAYHIERIAVYDVFHHFFRGKMVLLFRLTPKESPGSPVNEPAPTD